MDAFHSGWAIIAGLYQWIQTSLLRPSKTPCALILKDFLSKSAELNKLIYIFTHYYGKNKFSYTGQPMHLA